MANTRNGRTRTERRRQPDVLAPEQASDVETPEQRAAQAEPVEHRDSVIEVEPTGDAMPGIEPDSLVARTARTGDYSMYRYIGGLDEVVVKVGEHEYRVRRGDRVSVPKGGLDEHADFEPASAKQTLRIRPADTDQPEDEKE